MGRQLSEYAQEIVNHRRENPSHKINCECLDNLIQSMKNEITEIIPTAFTYNISKHTETTSRYAFAYVLNQISRSI